MPIELPSASQNEHEGKIRLSLIDVIYGVIIGYGFNFFVDKDPTDVTFILFLLAIAAIICDWLFVHKPYWTEPDTYTNLPFLIDLAILLSFAFMIRFSARDPHAAVLLTLTIVFLFYALWDFIYRKSLTVQGRSWRHDLLFDASGALIYFLLWHYAATKPLTAKLIYFDLPDWLKFDIEIQLWMALAILIFLIFGPHPLADRIKSLSRLAPKIPAGREV